jgi:hypothetical protein
VVRRSNRDAQFQQLLEHACQCGAIGVQNAT